jgi:pimeloyl-[acyl-carrier protein] synthase
MIAEMDGQRLSDDEVIATTLVTSIGGHETTTNLIVRGLLAPLRNPESLDLLRSGPEIVAASAVEDLLRYKSPVQHTAGIAPSATELGGKNIAKGAKVVAVLAAANRDPNRFPEPDRLDLLRSDNRHLAFGWAGQIAFNTLLCRLKNPVLREDKLQWRENAGLRGLTKLRITLHPQP